MGRLLHGVCDGSSNVALISDDLDHVCIYAEFVSLQSCNPLAHMLHLQQPQESAMSMYQIQQFMALL